MAGVPYNAWLSRMERAVRQRGKSPRSVLDVACGTGTLSELLWRRGYRPVVGFDIAEGMVQIAQTKALARRYEIDYHVANVAELDLGDQQFELLISLFDSLNYVLDPQQLQEGFRRLYAHAAPGAVFAFDLNSVYALRQNLFTQKETNGPIEHEWHAHWNEAEQLCRVEMDFWIVDAHTGERRYFHEQHLQRAYALNDIKAWLTSAGWERTEVFGNYGERAPNARSDRWLFVTEKRGENDK